MIDEHKDKRKYNNFDYHSTKFWLKGNDTSDTPFELIVRQSVGLLVRHNKQNQMANAKQIKSINHNYKQA